MYKYLKEASSYELIINKSRFISFLYPFSSPTELNFYLQQLRLSHPKANHYCYAYLLKNNTVQKYSDDGEPNKTAGFPMLEVLLKNRLDDVLVIVVRYFGGIKLGANGLTRSYRAVVADAIKNANLVTMIETNLYSVAVEYHLLDKLANFLTNNCRITKTDYGNLVEFFFYCLHEQNLDKINNLIKGAPIKIIGSIKVELD